MTDKAGVWIDHRKAVVVTVSSEGEHTTLITSNVEKHPERGGDSPLKGAYEARHVPADDKRQRALTGELNIYYDAVIAALRSYDSLLIFGFTAAVVGGLDSAVGAVVGGLVLGIALSLLDNYVSNDIDSFFVFALLIVVLMVRPNGLFARTAVRRV